MSAQVDRRPEWLRRKHAKQRSEPYRDLLAAASRCRAADDRCHNRSVIITSAPDLDGHEHPIGYEVEARNVIRALYRSRPRGGDDRPNVSIPKPEMIERADGTWEIRACVHPKIDGDAYITADPARKSYDPAERRSAAMAHPGRRRPSRAVEAEQIASRQAFADVLDEAAHGKKVPDPARVPVLPPAEPGNCVMCGARLDPSHAARGGDACLRCEMKQALVDLRVQEAADRRGKEQAGPLRAPRQRQASGQPQQARSAGRPPTTPVQRLAAFLASGRRTLRFVRTYVRRKNTYPCVRVKHVAR